MRPSFYLLAISACLFFASLPSYGSLIETVFINELHYDNAGTDEHEFIELAGLAGTDLTGWTIQLYNGNGGGFYDDLILLSGIFNDDASGFGFISFDKAGLQNGASDGIALIDHLGQVVQFLSYEGSLTAVNGSALGLTSTDIGVTESNSTPVGYSLQLGGTGYRYQDFYWQQAMNSSYNQLNIGQRFMPPNQVPEPSSLLLWLGGTWLLMLKQRKKTLAVTRVNSK